MTEKDEANLGVLLVTQYPEETLACDRLLVLHQGRLIMDGQPRIHFEDTERFHALGLDIPIEIELEKIYHDNSR